MIVRIWAWFIIYFTHYIPLSCSPWFTNPLSFPKKMGFDLYPIDFEWVRSWRYKPSLFYYVNYVWKILVISIRKQDLDKKAEILWLYQHKVHSSLVSIHSCKMVCWTRLSYNGSLIVCVLFCVSSGSAGGQYSTNTFLYSLKNYYGYGYFKQDITNGYYSYSYYGPTFGGGYDMHIANNAGRNTNSYFNCHSYRSGPYCDNSIWVGTRYGNNFRPDELEVYYEVLAWNRAVTQNKESIKNNQTATTPTTTKTSTNQQKK